MECGEGQWCVNRRHSFNDLSKLDGKYLQAMPGFVGKLEELDLLTKKEGSKE